jgi:hypothetical protein
MELLILGGLILTGFLFEAIWDQFGDGDDAETETADEGTSGMISYTAQMVTTISKAWTVTI